MINKSTKSTKVRSLIATAFLVVSFSLGAHNVFAEESTAEKVEVEMLELEEKTESKVLKWNAKMGYIEIPLNLKDVNFNVLIDGEQLASDNYSLNENKTTLFIHPGYLASLKIGDYKLQIKNLDQEKLISELTISIVEEGNKITTPTSKNDTVESKEPKTSASTKESKSTSAKPEINENTSVDTNASDKDQAVSSENNTDHTSKKIVNPIRPEFNKDNESLSREKKNNAKSDTSGNNGQVDAKLTAENSKKESGSQESANKKSASTIASTGVGFASIQVSSLILVASAAINSVKRKFVNNQKNEDD